MRATRGAAAAMLAVLLAAAAPGSASPIPPEPQLWVVHSDGGSEMMIAESWGIDAPEWSPDGTRMVYAHGGLFVADADGANVMQLSIDGETASEPRWSPDGRWIAYSSYAPPGAPGGGLRLVTPDGAERRTLAPFSVSGLAWSSHGTRLSYVRGRGGEPGSLYVIDVATGAETLVEPSAALYSWTEWSPAGSLIAFRGWGGELRVIAPDGTGERELSEGLGYVGAASWSPTGAEITFDAGESVYISAPDGSLRRAVVEGITPDWSPDGTEIAFARSGDIFRIRPDGTGDRRVTENHLRTDHRPAWAPNMERIALVGTPRQVLCGGFPWGVEANIIGTPENDHLEGTDGRDVIAGLEGDDTIEGLGGDDLICGGAGNDILSGGGGSDFVDGGLGADALDGDEGPDELVGAGGDDAIDGGPGRDVVSHTGAPGGVRVDLARGRASGWGDDVIVDVENASGSSGDDLLEGDGGANVLRGAAIRWMSSGDDMLVGRRGRDRLIGRDGADLLRGGRGGDYLDGGKHRRRAGDRLRGGPGYDRCRRGEDVRSCEP